MVYDHLLPLKKMQFGYAPFAYSSWDWSHQIILYNSYGNQTRGWEFHEKTWASEAFEWEEIELNGFSCHV
jgi:hypothetical protein